MNPTPSIMKRFPFLLLTLLAIFSCTKEPAEKPATGNPAGPLDEEIVFSYEEGIFAATTIPYRKAVVNGNSGTRPVLCLYLHGGSSRGSDNEAQLLEPAVDSIVNYLSANNISAIVIVPQCPSNRSWGGTMNRPLKLLVESFLPLVDTSRIYCFGGSMGGTGVWSLLNYDTHLFAAGMTVAGNPTGCNPDSVFRTSVCAVVSSADEVIDHTQVTDFFFQLPDNAPVCSFNIVNGWTHQETCEKSYNTPLLSWMFNRRR